MKNNPEVSIIIPVYNAGMGLLRCVDSVLCQSFTDWELIMVNDGSTDSSASLCDELAASNDKIKVVHKENGGVSSARNTGLCHSTGKWITFVDSDDRLDRDFLSNLMGYSDEFPFVIGGFKWFGDKSDEAKPNESVSMKVMDDIPVFWERSVNKFIFWYVWGKLYRSDVIKDNHIVFHENMKYSEDHCFVMEYLSTVDSLMYLSYIGYWHLFEKGRSKKYRMRFDVFHTHMFQQEECFKKLESKTHHRFVKIRQNVHRRFFDCFIYSLLNEPNYSSYLSEYNKFIEKYPDRTLLDEVSYSHKRRLLRNVLFVLPPRIGYMLRHLFLKIAY